MSSEKKPKTSKVESRREAGERTRAVIMDVAEQLFAQKGVDAVSLRSIMTTAGVSISLINYHFSTKENLIQQIFERRAVPMNQERMALLDAMRAGSRQPSLEDLLHVFVVLPIKASFVGGSENFMRLMGRISADPSPSARKIMGDYFDDFHRTFFKEIKKLMPELSETDFYWRLHCLLGVLMYTMTNPERTYDLSRGLCNPRDVETTVKHLMPMLIALITTPQLQTAASAEQKTSNLFRVK